VVIITLVRGMPDKAEPEAAQGGALPVLGRGEGAGRWGGVIWGVVTGQPVTTVDAGSEHLIPRPG